MSQVFEYSIENLFYEGKFKKIIQPSTVVQADDVGFLVGSYAMIQSVDLAEKIFLQRKNEIIKKSDVYCVCLFKQLVCCLSSITYSAFPRLKIYTQIF